MAEIVVTYQKLPTGEIKWEIAAEATVAQISPQITKIVSDNPILMFSKTGCPFCLEMKRTLSSYGVVANVIEIDLLPQQNNVLNALSSITNTNTVPQLFVNGTFHADCNGLKKMEFEGDLLPLLAPFMTYAINRGNRVDNMGFLYFPESPNNIFRLSAFMVWMWCMLCIIFFRHFETRYAILALAIDRILAFVYGGTACPIGMIATLLLSKFPSQSTAGPPKQVAAFCAACFSTFAAGFMLAERMTGHGRPYRIGAAVILAVFAGDAFLEWAFDWCAGCWMYSKIVHCGFINADVYRPFIAFKVFREFENRFKNAEYQETIPEHGFQRERVSLPAYRNETAVDLWVKKRMDAEWKQQDIHIIKHTKVEHFGIALSTATLAYMYRMVSIPVNSTSASGGIALGWGVGFAWQVLVLASLISFFITTALYFLRMMMYPKKVKKEWNHPIIGNFFSIISMCIVIYGILYYDYDLWGGLVLVWIGAGLQMFITIWKFSDWVFERTGEEFVNPTIMLTPVANFVVAIGFGVFNNIHRGNKQQDVVQYNHLARFWFAIAALFAIVFFTITCRKAMLETWSDRRNKWSLWVWLATASVFGPAFLQCQYESDTPSSIVYQSLHYIAIFFFAVMAMGWMRGFFSYGPVFDMATWLMPFAFAALAINTSQYYSYHQAHGLWYVLTIITIVIASVSGSVCLLHTLLQISNGSMWLPRVKWSPANFIILTHEAFRAGLPKLLKGIGKLEASDNNNAALAMLLEDMSAFSTCYLDHSRHEDDIIVPYARRIYPGLGTECDSVHAGQQDHLNKFLYAIEEYNKSPKDKVAADILLKLLKTEFPLFCEGVLVHLRDEEFTFIPTIRKHASLEQQIEINRQCFHTTAGPTWFIAMPWIVRSLPHPEWKLQYVASFVWANPDRAQEIGMMLYRGLDSVTWCFLVANIPSIIPRGSPGYRKIH